MALESYSSTVVTISSAYTCASLSSGVCNTGNAIDTLTTGFGGNIQNSGHDNVDVAYQAQGAGGANFITVSVSSDPTAQGFNYYFQEEPPPNCNGSPCNSSFDKVATCSSASACGSVSITATDGMIGFLDSGTTVSNITLPYVVEQTGNLFGLDITSAPAFSITTGSYWTTSQVFFKTNGGSYTPTAAKFATVGMAPPPANTFNGTALNCTTCTVTPGYGASTSGNSIVVQAFNTNGQTISSVTGRGGSWNVPTGANTCQNTAVNAMSCAWTASNTGGSGNLTVTMSGACPACYFAVYEFSRTSGTTSVDAQNSSSGVGTTTLSGQTLTLTSTDVCFDEITWTTTTPVQIGTYLYPQPGGANMFGGYVTPQSGVSLVLLNTTSGTAPQIRMSASAASSASAGICFK